MAMAMTFLGLSPMGANDIPAINDNKNTSAYIAGQTVVDCVMKNRLPRDMITQMILILTCLMKFLDRLQ